MPGDSVFVATKESIHLPKNLVARVLIKNSRLRQGFTLDAPLYFPGHETVVYFRVTNVSSDEISLSPARPIAQLTFEEVSGEVEHPYQGAFSNEFEFKGLAAAVAADLAQTNGDLEPLAQALAESSRGKQTKPVGRRRTPRNAN